MKRRRSTVLKKVGESAKHVASSLKKTMSRRSYNLIHPGNQSAPENRIEDSSAINTTQSATTTNERIKKSQRKHNHTALRPTQSAPTDSQSIIPKEIEFLRFKQHLIEQAERNNPGITGNLLNTMPKIYTDYVTQIVEAGVNYGSGKMYNGI